VYEYSHGYVRGENDEVIDSLDIQNGGEFKPETLAHN
jgi:hypothetical protein